jgi:hypothetical protein
LFSLLFYSYSGLNFNKKSILFNKRSCDADAHSGDIILSCSVHAWMAVEFSRQIFPVSYFVRPAVGGDDDADCRGNW